MGNGEKGQARAYSHGNGHTVGSFQFDTNGTSAPDGLEDPGSIVKGAGVYAATGKHLFTLNRRYAKVYAVANPDAFTQHFACTVVDGMAADNSISIDAFSDAAPHAAEASTDIKVTVIVHMYDA